MSRKGVAIDSFTKHNILQDYRAGLPCALISQKYSVGENYPWRLAKQRGVSQRSKRLQEWVRQAVADAYADGEKSESIANEFNISRSHVRGIGKSFGHPPRPPKVKQPNSRESQRTLARARRQHERESLHA